MLRPLTHDEQEGILFRVKNGIYSCIAVMNLDEDRPEGTDQEFLNSYKEHSKARDTATGFYDILLMDWIKLSHDERQHLRYERLKAWFEYLETFPCSLPCPRTHPEWET